LDRTLAEKLDSHLRKAAEKLDTAAKLVEWGAFDDAVSRAYYAAFHAAKAMLSSQGFEAETHTGVKTLKLAGRVLLPAQCEWAGIAGFGQQLT
jgi:uncharacterized protein (UPF0332 family)